MSNIIPLRAGVVGCGAISDAYLTNAREAFSHRASGGMQTSRYIVDYDLIGEVTSVNVAVNRNLDI